MNNCRGRNFLAAEKLFYDVSARLFRKVIKEENRKASIPLPYRLDELQLPKSVVAIEIN